MALERNEGDSDEHDSQQGNDGLWRNHAGNQRRTSFHHHRAERSRDYREEGPARLSLRRVRGVRRAMT